MKTINITAHLDDVTQVQAIIAFMESLKVKFEISKEDGVEYNKEFVKNILQGDKDLKAGKGRKISLEVSSASEILKELLKGEKSGWAKDFERDSFLNNLDKKHSQE